MIKGDLIKTLSELRISWLFWFGLFLKIVFSFAFASQYSTDLFIPFTNLYVDSGIDPFDHFFSLGRDDIFPYPAMMLWAASSIKYFVSFLMSMNELPIFIQLLLIKAPALLFDISILVVLASWLPRKVNKVIIFYWLSPVLMYITYIHGQLDVIPIGFLVVGLYFLFHSKILISAIVFSFALTCKTNVLIAMPLMIVSLYRLDRSYRDVLKFMSISSLFFVLINASFFYSNHYIDMVYFNIIQNKIFDFAYEYSSGESLYFIPAALFVLVVAFAQIKTFSRSLIIIFLGVSFGILTVLIPPMQGWYYWPLPFVIYFLIKNNDLYSNIALMFFQGCYFVYFGLVENSDYLNWLNHWYVNGATDTTIYLVLKSRELNPEHLLNLSLTLLQTTFFLIGFWMITKGILGIYKKKVNYSPFLVGIAGDSGSGKTTIANAIFDIFNSSNTLLICGDGMHKWERGNQQWKNFTHLNPKANYLHHDMHNLDLLSKGKSVYRREYNHANGHFTDARVLKPKRIIIFEGLHSFFLNRANKLFDLKIFMKPSETLRKDWKIERDVNQRKKKIEDVLEQISSRKADAQQYIANQEQEADLIISYLENNGEIEALEIKLVNDIYIEDLLDELETYDEIEVEHLYIQNYQKIIIRGSIDKSEVKKIGDKNFSELKELGIMLPNWKNGFTGVIQLIICKCILQED